MSTPVRDITLDRPDYTAGAFIVFVEQNRSVSPPGAYSAEKAFEKVFIGDSTLGPGITWNDTTALVNYTVPAGRTLFITEVVLIQLSPPRQLGTRYPTSGYWYRATPQPVPAIYAIYRDNVGITFFQSTRFTGGLNVRFEVPLVFSAGQKFRLFAEPLHGSARFRVHVRGYETQP